MATSFTRARGLASSSITRRTENTEKALELASYGYVVVAMVLVPHPRRHRPAGVLPEPLDWAHAELYPSITSMPATELPSSGLTVVHGGRPSRKHWASTLIELLMVIAIVAVLASLL